MTIPRVNIKRGRWSCINPNALQYLLLITNNMWYVKAKSCVHGLRNRVSLTGTKWSLHGSSYCKIVSPVSGWVLCSKILAVFSAKISSPIFPEQRPYLSPLRSFIETMIIMMDFCCVNVAITYFTRSPTGRTKTYQMLRNPDLMFPCQNASGFVTATRTSYNGNTRLDWLSSSRRHLTMLQGHGRNMRLWKSR